MYFKRLLLLITVLGLAPTCAFAEEVTIITMCQLLADPGAYNHKLIQVTGRISRGFEDFTIHESCHSPDTVWLEIGGTTGSEVVYCCGVTAKPKRPGPLVVEDIETSLVQDAAFKKFQTLTKHYGTAKATIIGRYFSGTQRTFPGGTYWVGYGHMGIGSLLVIQQVVSVQQ